MHIMKHTDDSFSAARPAGTLLLLLVILLAAAPAARGQVSSAGERAGAQERPNIVLILADDLGYGDISSFNPSSKIRTPHVDRLAEEGMRLTDAHASGSWCTPSRYGLLTGRYPFRTEVRDWDRRALLHLGQVTLASLLKASGYATAMVGKWHLGFDDARSDDGTRFNCDRPLRGGPVDHGFDRFFGMPASLDIPPYLYIEQDECVAAPSQSVGDRQSADSIWTDIQGAFWRGGGVAPGFRHEGVLPRFTEEAVAVLESHRRAAAQQPLFLYLALTAPHTPWLPLAPHRDSSAAGLYGDFAEQTDAVVGQVLAALERLGMQENTLVIFTSDNGPVWYPKDTERFGHSATARYRGMKGDAWEGGHRMPFVARWPGQIPAGAVSDETIAFTDMLATTAALLDMELPPGAGEDSRNFLPVLLGEEPAEPVRDVLVHGGLSHSVEDEAIRQGPWKLIPWQGSGGFTEPRERPAGPEESAGQLYNLSDDPGERTNVYDEHPDVVRRLSSLLEDGPRAEDGPRGESAAPGPAAPDSTAGEEQ